MQVAKTVHYHIDQVERNGHIIRWPEEFASFAEAEQALDRQNITCQRRFYIVKVRTTRIYHRTKEVIMSPELHRTERDID